MLLPHQHWNQNAMSETLRNERLPVGAAGRPAVRLEIAVAVHLAADSSLLVELAYSPYQLVDEIAQDLVEASKFPVRPCLFSEGVQLAPFKTLLDAGIRDGAQIFADISYPLALTTSQDGSAKLWNGDTAECMMSFEGHDGPVLSASITPSYRWIVTASEDRTAKVWGVKSGKCVSTLVGHGHAVYAATFSSNFILVLTASADCTARIWSFEGDCKKILYGHSRPVFSAVFSDDGESVVTLAKDSKRKVWSVKTGKCQKTSWHDVHDESRYVTSYSPDGSCYIVPELDVALICLTHNSQILHRLEGHEAPLISASFAIAWAAPEPPKPRAIAVPPTDTLPFADVSLRSPRRHRKKNRFRDFRHVLGPTRERREQSNLEILRNHLAAARRGDGHPYFGRQSTDQHHSSTPALPSLPAQPSHLQSSQSLPLLPALGKNPFAHSQSEAALVNHRSLGRQVRSIDQTSRVFQLEKL